MQSIALAEEIEMPKKTVHTLEDIAQIAGVSRSTVSRALNNSALISQETRERIQAIAQEHDFRMNVAARNLRLQQSNTIAFVAPIYNSRFLSVEDLFGMAVMSEIGKGLYALGYDLLTIYADLKDTEWVQTYLDSNRVDGFILLGSNYRKAHVDALMAANAPFISWEIPPADLSYCSVSGDNVMGGKLATQHLIDTGRQQIAFLGGPEDERTVKRRFEGYQTALQAAGRSIDPNLVVYGNYTYPSGISAMERLLAQAPEVDGVFVNSDLMAIGAISAIQQAGKQVPADIAVVGYDDLAIAAYNNLPLTTIRQNFALIGQLLAENLIQYLQTGEITNVTTPVELVIRKST